jgi:hypothetical protein
MFISGDITFIISENTSRRFLFLKISFSASFSLILGEYDSAGDCLSGIIPRRRYLRK